MHKAIIAATACIVLGACAPVDRGFGETVRVNNLRQTINPEGTEASPGGPLEGGNGARANTAIERYESDTVTQPAQESTRGSGGGSGGSTK